MARKERKDNRQRCVNIDLIIFFVWPWWIINDVEEEKMQKMVSCYAYDQVTVDLFSFLDCNPISNHVKLL